MFDLSSATWHLSISPLELVVRSLVVYALLLAALRLSGKRELGQFTIFDLAFALLAANALQPAITGPDASLPGAVIIVATLFAANRAVAWGRRRSLLVRRLLDQPPTVIARDGSWIESALAREGLDEEDLSAALRSHDLEDVAEVQLAVLESSGTISVIRRLGPPVSMPTRRRRYGPRRRPG